MRKGHAVSPDPDDAPAGIRLFVRHTLTWAVALALVATLQNVIRAPNVALRPGHLEYVLAQMLALFLVFGAFAGGVAVFGGVRRGGSKLTVIAGGVLVGLLVFLLDAQIAPRLEYRADVLRGIDLEVYAPFGPLTPRGYREWLGYLREHPPTELSRSVERLRQHPPARVEFMLHQQYVLPVLAVLLGLLGYVSAELTAPVRPSRRRHLRWLIGLTMLPLVIVPLDAFETTTLVARPFGSGAALAWAGLIAPGAVLTICQAVADAVRVHGERLGRRSVARSPGG